MFLGNKKIWITIAIIIVTIILMQVIKYIIKRSGKILNKRIKKNTVESNKYINILYNCIKYIILLIALCLILQLYGVNISSIIASLGIVSVVIGLAIQDVLKDFIMGVNIVVGDYFTVGDIISVDGIEGVVTHCSLKTTKIKDLKTGAIYSISNRNIDKMIKLSDWMDIDIPLSYSEKITTIEKVLDIIIKEVKENKNIKDIRYLGIKTFADSSIEYKLRIWCDMNKKYEIERYVNRIIKIKLDENNLEIPFKQIDIHNK